jgi:aspartyl-tRNA(Asn)/glutamyl-tRNA(Gln) amidotransferase subunit A
MSGPHGQATGKGSLPEPEEGFLSDINGSIKGLRIGWSPNLGSIPVEKDVAVICEKAAQRFEALGAIVEDSGFIIDIEEVSETFGVLAATQDYINYGYLLAEYGEEMVSYVKEAIVKGKNTTAEAYALALARLERLRKYVSGSFSSYDLLMTPTLAVAPFPCGYRPEVIDGVKVPKMSGFYSMLYPFNMSGNPSASIPCGFTIDNLPVGLHIVGRQFDELTILNASLAFEEAHPWAHLRPLIS